MKLAFVIPAYNEEALIGKCLESVVAEIARSGADAEIIVVNNASSDRTGEIPPVSGLVPDRTEDPVAGAPIRGDDFLPGDGQPAVTADREGRRFGGGVARDFLARRLPGRPSGGSACG